MSMPGEPSGRRLRIGLIVALVGALTLLCCGGTTASFFLGGLGGESVVPASFGCGDSEMVDPDLADLPRAGLLGAEQTRNAAIIIRVGQELNVPPRGWVIAVATAMQESWLRNLGHLGERNDHDSLGLFQQRPSAGWGTPEQVTDPEYAARKFYEKLITINGWQTLSLTDAAQRVQISAYPDAYAKHEPTATNVVNLLTDGAARAVGAIDALRCVSAGEISASGWTAPIVGPVGSEFRSASRPTHQGVDITAPRETPVRAASGGVVVKVRCRATTEGGWNWGCDRDGSSSIRGCGWYIEIMHADAVITRYCHLVRRPLVNVGQAVAAGEELGRSGSSGRSSGPHLHFEVHINGDSGDSGAVDPIQFMRERGAPLGEPT
ncbi:MAG TPA: M23 family metallopeptidase [Micromonosporaceae bacterium]|nr:M23 family metallopeptidase [Micromonosporaceae bacterium]